MTQRSGNRGGRRLSGEDRMLWEHLTRNLDPLARGKARVLGFEELLADSAAEDDKPARKGRAGLRHPPLTSLRQHDEKSKTATAARPKRDDPPPLAAFDRKTAKKLRSGRREIEARIDLHGLRQADAHEALRRFLLRCHANDLSTVLVITGKGKTAGMREQQDGYGYEERGVLKRNVPRWLDEADMRALVVSYTSAAVRHGGEGALYIHLRRKARAAGSD